MSGINFDDTEIEIAGTVLKIAGKLRFPIEILTIATGVVTPTGTYIVLEGEGSAADDLNTIQGGIAGDVLYVRIAGGDIITLKDGVGNLQMAGDFAMNSVNDSIMFICISTNVWAEVSRSNNT